MQCNIDQRGRVVRFVGGATLEGIGFVLLVLGAIDFIDGIWPIVVGIVLMVAGSFVLMEAIIGWCALRAMGVKTPL